jgi:RNA-directed DNA polymerase
MRQQHISKSRELQRALYRAAKQSRTRRFHALYDRMYREDVLRRAWAEVKANKGASGVDKVEIADIEASGVAEFLKWLGELLKANRYHAKPVLRSYILKPNGERRPLGIPTVCDRVVQAACKIVIEPIFDATFEDCSYGYRPKRMPQQAVEKVTKTLIRGWHVLDADIQKFFDTIDHDIMMGLVKRRISDRRILKLIYQWMTAAVVEDGQRQVTEKGTPQGGVISPLLANIYLHVLDRYWNQECAHLGTLIRYADDFVIICRERYQANMAKDKVKHILGRLKLKLSETKTKIVWLTEEGFEFLGFHFCKRVTSKTRKLLPYAWASKKSIMHISEKIRKATNSRFLKSGLEEIVKWVNPIIRGWRNYYQIGNCSKQLIQLDKFVYNRFRLLYKRKYRRRLSRHMPAFRQWFTEAGINPFRVRNL